MDRYEDPAWAIERQLADLYGERQLLLDSMTQANSRLREIYKEQDVLLAQLREIQGVRS